MFTGCRSNRRCNSATQFVCPSGVKTPIWVETGELKKLFVIESVVEPVLFVTLAYLLADRIQSFPLHLELIEWICLTNSGLLKCCIFDFSEQKSLLQIRFLIFRI